MISRLAASLLLKPYAANALQQACSGAAVAALQRLPLPRHFTTSHPVAFAGRFGSGVGSGGIPPIRAPRNLGITIVPERTAVVVER
jgi:hypothetical protein